MTVSTQNLLRSALALLALAMLGTGAGCKSYQLGHPAELQRRIAEAVS